MSSLGYNVIEVFTSEEARWKGQPLYEAVVRLVSERRLAARCIVSRGIAGCFENGEIASHHVLDLSVNMPLKIEIILPAPELELILPSIEEMVTDGIVVVEDMEIRSHRASGRLLPRGLRVRDLMTRSPRTAELSTPASELVELIEASEFNGIPIVDTGGRIVGMVTAGDIVARAKPRDGDQVSQPAGVDHVQVLAKPASEIMTPRPVTLREDADLADAVRVMVEKGLKRLPVVDKEGKLVGVLSRIDILRVAAASTSRLRRLEHYDIEVRRRGPVAQAMMLDVPVVLPEIAASQALNLIDNSTQRVVVADENGRLLGLISGRALLALLRAGSGKESRQLETKTARDIMDPDPISIEETAPLEQALELMVANQLKRLPVVDGERHYLGMLSRHGLLEALTRS